MKLQKVPARQGIVWVREGFAVFFKQPLAFAALFACFAFVNFALFRFIPDLGVYVSLALLPAVSLGFMLASRTAVAGGTPTPRVFVDAFRGSREQVVAMIKLGVSLSIAAFLIFWVSDILDGGVTEDLFDDLVAGKITQEAAAAAMRSDPRIEFGLLLRSLLATLLSIPYWHAPALVHWDRHGFAKSLFSSTIACWRNKGAFTLYSITWFIVLTFVSVVLQVMMILFGSPEIAALSFAPISLMLSTIFYASFFFTFADCFSEDSPDEDGTTLT